MKKIITALASLVFVSSVFASAAENDYNRVSSNPETETEECVLANSTDRYRVTFYAGEEAMVLVSGDGDTDLDLYIYDEYDNLVAYDNDGLDTMLCTWIPKRTATFTIVIRNLGDVRNYYTMWTY